MTQDNLLHTGNSADCPENARMLPPELPPMQDPAAHQQIEAGAGGSRKFLQTIIDTEPECVKLVASDGSLIMMNPAGLSMIQADSLEQVKGMSIYPLVLPAYREAFEKLTEAVFQGGQGTLLFEMVGLRGRHLWLDTHAVPLRNEKEEIVALLGITRDVTERRQAVNALEQEKKFSDGIIDSLPGIFLICDETGRLIRWNDNEKQVTGYSVEEFSHMNMYDLFRDDHALIADKIEEVFKTGQASFETMVSTKSGIQVPVILTAFRMILNEKRYFVGIGIDISERKRLEDQLRHSQKMESIGTLAGGISHDFNNILTAIIGYGSLMQMKLGADDPLRYSIDQILASANRAANLTQGLLAYSRKQILNPQAVNLNEVIRKVEGLLMRLIGEDLELKTILTDRDVTILADAGQIEQVLMNLVTNARDAMPEGGCLFIEIETIELDEESAKTTECCKPGTYAVIIVTDSGMGMNEKVRERIFEPFFTTKEAGKGTGLGLAMVYGIVKQHGGWVEVESEVNKGTTFRIYLPVIRKELKEVRSAELPAIRGGTETILVAEDDETVRNLTCNMLEQFGYTVIRAVDGEEAVNKCLQNRETVRLLLLDVIMPKKNGKEVYDKIKIFQPDMKALFISGYTADIIGEKGVLDKELNFILKPVPVNDLLRKVRMILDGA